MSEYKRLLNSDKSLQASKIEYRNILNVCCGFKSFYSVKGSGSHLQPQMLTLYEYNGIHTCSCRCRS